MEQEYGYLLCNPPYGERLSEKKEVEKLYRQLGKLCRKRLKTWSYFIFTGHTHFEKHFGRKADKKRKLYNGFIRCDFYQYFGPKPPKKAAGTLK